MYQHHKNLIENCLSINPLEAASLTNSFFCFRHKTKSNPHPLLFLGTENDYIISRHFMRSCSETEKIKFLSSHMLDPEPDDSIPIIDFSLLISSCPEQRYKIIHDLGKACQEWGFFMVINHGVPESLIKSMMDTCKRFFDLTEEEKREFEGKAVLDPIRYGTSFNASVDKVCKSWQQTSIPPCPQPDLAMGMPPHSDHGLLTLLIQNENGGLQLQHNGKWVNVNASSNSFMVNTADHIEILSNGKYKSIVHRAVVNNIRTKGYL
ncbi:hypothetical protein Pint_33400 [Pistacia integerrima]|uniref:Uncharacterized protein n=1 Tax=Pistacia integerrima TaxID=434235 RepID=A0ACC0X736_9ROSI|nr:hypothetical protein Pint_33400 [Pistacia integerrima]